MSSGEVAAVIWIVVGVGIAIAWGTLLARWLRRSIPRRRHAHAVRQYASSRGWSHEVADWVDTGFGDPFVAGEQPWCTNVVRGRLNGRAFLAFESDVREQVFLLELPERLPFLEVRPHTLAEDAGFGDPSFEVESIEFNDEWQVLAASRKYASAVLQPTLLADLLDGPSLAWRIYEQRLVAWCPGFLDPLLIEPAIDVLHNIESSIPAHVWADYAERCVTPNPNDVLPY